MHKPTNDMKSKLSVSSPTTTVNGEDRHRSNSCIGIPDETTNALNSMFKDRKISCMEPNNSNNLLYINQSSLGFSSSSLIAVTGMSAAAAAAAGDPVIESSLALRRLSQAFGKQINFY